jgi:Nucleosome assembly protein (NAP)
VRKARPTESFFNFFTPPPPIDDDAEIDEDDLEEIEEKLEMDYQIGEDLKEKVRRSIVLYRFRLLTDWFRSFPVPSITSLERHWNTKLWMILTRISMI